MNTRIISQQKFVVLGVICAFGLVISGCKSSPAEKNVVIPPEYAKLMRNAEKQGFQKGWGKPEEIRKYDKINIAVQISPVQIEESWWAKQNIRNLVSSKKNDMKDVAKYTQIAFVKAFQKSKHFKVVQEPGPKTLALEFSIVQLIPNKPGLGAVSNLTNLTPIGIMISPIKLGAKSASQESGGAIAMETIIRDSKTGNILAVIAERAKGKVAFFNAKEFTAYANVRAIIDEWTRKIALAMDQVKEGKKVNVKPADSWSVIDY